MLAVNKTHSIKEFSYINKGDINCNFFEALKEFASHEKNYEILKIAKGGNALYTQQYVGIITTKQGDTLEIFPKIDMVKNDDNNSTSKTVLLKMLASLNPKAFRQYDNASLSAEKSSILEIFITLFLQELSKLVKKGIKHDYMPVEGNFPFFKGKLNVAKQIQDNLIHKERFYIQFDERSMNVTENKIIKSTLLLLNQISSNFQNKAQIVKYLAMFDNVSPSYNPPIDFKQCQFNRANQYYQKPIEWCKIFLAKNSFNIYSGKHIAYALLFNMQDLFEAYVTKYFEQNYSNVTSQKTWWHLLETPKLHPLRPDIILGDKNNCIILDAKWKNYADKDFSSGDLYQLYAYGKKYNTQHVCLVYPKSKKFNQAELYQYDDSLNLHVLCFDCVDDTMEHNIGALESHKKD